jgi:selenocysteine lyase/cysteine desulfurase
MKRTEFLRTLAGSLAATALLPEAFSSPKSLSSRSPFVPPLSGMDPYDERLWSFIRAQFPLTTERIYLNTGGLGASPYAVIDAVKEKMDELERISETGHSEELWKQIKSDAASLLGCEPEELAFTRNTTEGINIVANGLPLREGDEVIMTTHEHVGNAVTWLALQKKPGIVLKRFEPSTVSQQENLDRIDRLLTGRTRLINVPHVVTTTGLVMPVKGIAELARKHGSWFFLDGAQTAGMFPFSLKEMGCDAYATSGHKWLVGPKETGLLFVRKSMWDTIQAKFIGAYSGADFDFLKGVLKLHPSAQRYEYGTVSVPLRYGLWAAIRFLQRIGVENVWKRDRVLATRLHDELKNIPGVRVLSPDDDSMRSAMITFMHDKKPYLEVQEHLNKFNLRTRAVSEGGLAALRISLHIYNNLDEVERVVEGVRSIAE